MLPWFTKYPNQNDEILNLDWVIRQVENLKAAYEAFLAADSLTFADPIQWDITKQYSKNTIVLSSEGDAYLSKKVVGKGIQLNNTEYWLEIFNFAEYVRTANSNLTIHIEQNTTRATAAYAVDDWLLWEDVLYKVTAAIALDDLLTVGTNIVHFTVEDFCRAWQTYMINTIAQYKLDIDASELQFNNTMTGLVNQYKNDIDASELAYRNQLAQDISDTTASLQSQLDVAIAGATVDSEVINIRVGANGITYSTAGDAVRGQVSDLKSAINVLNESVLTFVPQETNWTKGKYETDGYGSLGSDTVKYSKKFSAGEYIITPTEHLRWEAFYYVSDGSGTQMYSFSTNTRQFVATDDFIITIAKEGGGDMTGLDIEIAHFSIVKKNDAMLNNRSINQKSWEVNTDRYNNITYIDRMEYSSLEVGNASAVALDADIRFKDAPNSIRLTTNSSRTSSEIRINYASSFTLLGTQEFEVYLYIKDATKVTGVRLQIPESSWVKSNESLHNGWNKVRLSSRGAGSWSDSTANTQIRVLVYHISGLTEDVYIGGIVQVKPQYANMIIIADGPYYSVYSDAYPALKSLGVPIVWALDATLLDTDETFPRELIKKSELDVLAYDGLSEFSFHSYDGTIMSTATQDEALADTLKSIRFLRQNGLQPNHVWRAAWLQNNCPNHGLSDLELEASACHDGTSQMVSYPFPDKYNIPRMGLAQRNTEWFDTLFTNLQREHNTVLVYFHGVSDGERDISATMLTYFLDKLEDALDEGYLMATTYDRLISYYSKI